MYEYLEGEVAGRSAARLVLEVGGVGYDLAVPVGAAFPREGRVRAWTHLVVREDSHQLFGFPDRGSRELFRLLLTVGGVGPKIALGVLSGLARDELLAAIQAGDAARLTRIRGIGRKTAEQILLDLRDKAASIASALRGDGEKTLTPPAQPVPVSLRLLDAAAALVSIGYSEKEARKAVERVAPAAGDADLETLVRAALQG